MRSLLAVLTLLPLVLSQGDISLHTTNTTLDPNQPIYLGDVFLAPSMNFIAWLPSQHTYRREWCYRAADATDHVLFSLGGVAALQMHDYFSEQAYITREGRRFANCYVTPESGHIGACAGVVDYDSEDGLKHIGKGMRVWSCWIIQEELRPNRATDEILQEAIMYDRLPDAMFTPTATGATIETSMADGFVATGASIVRSMMDAFTASVTGS
jgi:hypothetical protein